MMARKPRIEYPGGIYHVIQRANNREFFFEDNAMKGLLLDLIADYRKWGMAVPGVDLLTYWCLQVPDGTWGGRC